MAIRSRKLLNRNDKIELEKFERCLRVIEILKSRCHMPENTIQEKAMLLATAYSIVYEVELIGNV